MDIGALRHRVELQNPGAAVPDGDGGFTQTWSALSPSPVWVSITPASARELERLAAGTVLSTASHIVRGRFHPGVSTKTRIVFGTRLFSVTGVANTEEKNEEMILTAVEVVQ